MASLLTTVRCDRAADHFDSQCMRLLTAGSEVTADVIVLAMLGIKHHVVGHGAH